MSAGPRVKRSAGPKSKLTEATYRKKALPHLLRDFQNCCAYCLDPDEFRHPSYNHVEHFDCKPRGRTRNRYKNLMLSCGACNLSKHDKPVTNPFEKEQSFLNCTIENEFPLHITELDNGEWKPMTKRGDYHLQYIGLTEPCHNKKRAARRIVANQVLELCTKAIQYKSANPTEVHKVIIDTARALFDHLNNFPPMVTDKGVVHVREWLSSRGVDLTLFDPCSLTPV